MRHSIRLRFTSTLPFKYQLNSANPSRQLLSPLSIKGMFERRLPFPEVVVRCGFVIKFAAKPVQFAFPPRSSILLLNPFPKSSSVFDKIKLTRRSHRQIAMGRFETLNADTQDLVCCLLPALASSFGLSDPVDIIPEDIRMRAWDCERRDHIKDQTENDPRNWGVQFLKDLKAIARLKGGNLALFHSDLRAKVAKHEDKHPWARLNDIREIKDDYEHPNRPPPVVEEDPGTSSTDSYLEELHEPDLPPSMKAGRKRHHEIYEARVQPKRRKGKHMRMNIIVPVTDNCSGPPPPQRRRWLPSRRQDQKTRQDQRVRRAWKSVQWSCNRPPS